MASNPIQMIAPEHVHSTTPLIAFGFSWLMDYVVTQTYNAVVHERTRQEHLLGAILSGFLLIAATRGRMCYREEVDTVFDEAAAVR
jgi:hypothetical protein